jgi:phosphoribosylamine-glycine ligase
MNVLAIMKTDFLDVCRAIVDGTLDKLHVEFERLLPIINQMSAAGLLTLPGIVTGQIWQVPTPSTQ